MTLLTNAVPLLWLIASAGAFFLVFRPKADWPVVATPIRALSVFVLVFIGGACLTAVTRPDDTPPPKPQPTPAARLNLPDPALVRAHPERYLKLDRVKADRGEAVGGERGAVLLTGGVINTSGLAIGKLTLSCRLTNGSAPAATVSTAIGEVVPAAGKLIFAALKAGQVDKPWDRWACEVTKAEVASG
jgi:hypothetical protein